VLDPDEKVEKDRLPGDVKHTIDILTKAATSLEKYEETRNKLLGAIGGHEGEDLRMKAQTLKELIVKDRKEIGSLPKEVREMEDALSKISTENRVMALNIVYSPEYIKDLAGYLALEVFGSRASLPLHIHNE
jgi:uncharacterized protein YoxC